MVYSRKIQNKNINFLILIFQSYLKNKQTDIFEIE